MPEGAKVVASNDFCENAALLYDDRTFTVQAHPEFRPEFVDGLMKTRGPGLVPDALSWPTPRRGSTRPSTDRAMADRIADFLQSNRGREAPRLTRGATPKDV